jgi:predicted dehydrogenase
LQQGGEDHVETVEGTGTTYRYQLLAFVDAVRTGRSLPTIGADSIHNMRLIDAVVSGGGVAGPRDLSLEAPRR